MLYKKEAESMLKKDRRRGLGLVLTLLSDPETPSFFRAEGADLLQGAAGKRFDYDPDRTPVQNAGALAALCAHLTPPRRAP